MRTQVGPTMNLILTFYKSSIELSLPLRGGIVLVILMLLLFWLGVYPTPFVDLIQTALASSNGPGSRPLDNVELVLDA